MFEWSAKCSVCESAGRTPAKGRFVVDTKDETNPYPHGCLCPDCRELGLVVVGVLNFEQRRQIGKG